MIPYQDVKTLVLDYDGTLHESNRIYAPAFRKAYGYLVEQGEAEERAWGDGEIAYWLGFTVRDMWKGFMPGLDEALKEVCSRMIGEEGTALTREGKARLYPGVLETLEYLKEKGYRLVFLSNCSKAYMELHTKQFGLECYFDGMYCAEAFDNIPKHLILAQVKSLYPEPMVMVGDRKQDMEAGRKNGIYTLGCTYGYATPGELDGADDYLERFADLRHRL